MSKSLTKEFLLSRKKCCQNGCQECPYGYNKNKNMGNKTLIDLLIPLQLEYHQLYRKANNLINKNMEEKEKYYIPDRKDFREGFEYEQLHCSYSPPDFKLFSSDWIKQVFDDFTSEENYLFNRYFQNNSIRVPFLTKEQIIAEGWEYSEESNSFIYDIKNVDSIYYTLIITGDKNRSGFKTIEIQFASSWNTSTIYYGLCPSINEFRTICKLLNIG